MSEWQSETKTTTMYPSSILSWKWMWMGGQYNLYSYKGSFGALEASASIYAQRVLINFPFWSIKTALFYVYLGGNTKPDSHSRQTTFVDLSHLKLVFYRIKRQDPTMLSLFPYPVGGSQSQGQCLVLQKNVKNQPQIMLLSIGWIVNCWGQYSIVGS